MRITQLIQRWYTLRRLCPADRLAIIQAIGWLSILPVPLRFLSFRRTQALMLRLSPPAATFTPTQKNEVARVVYLINRLCDWRLLHTNCLRRSLVLWWLLRRRGIESAIRIGVRKTANQFEAHAWVEWNGQVLGERSAYVEQYAPFAANFAVRHTGNVDK